MPSPKPNYIHNIERKSNSGQPWLIHLVYVQKNSRKFWKAEGAGAADPVTISWGRIGDRGRSVVKDLGYALKTSQAKIKKGYDYTWNLPYYEVGLKPQTKKELLTQGQSLLVGLSQYPSALEAEMAGLFIELDLFGEKYGIDVSPAKKEMQKTKKIILPVVKRLLGRVKKALPQAQKYAFFWEKKPKEPSSQTRDLNTILQGIVDLDVGWFLPEMVYLAEGEIKDHDDNEFLIEIGLSRRDWKNLPPHLKPWVELYDVLGDYIDTLGAQGDVESFSWVRDTIDGFGWDKVVKQAHLRSKLNQDLSPPLLPLKEFRYLLTASLQKTAGIFTFDCRRCGKSIPAGRDNWTKYAVAINEQNKLAWGQYDSYGRLENANGQVVFAEEYGSNSEGPTWYHYACWVASGKPKRWQGASPSHQDWGSSPPRYPLKTPAEGVPPGSPIVLTTPENVKPMGSIEPIDNVLVTTLSPKTWKNQRKLVIRVMRDEWERMGLPLPILQIKTEYLTRDTGEAYKLVFQENGKKSVFLFRVVVHARSGLVFKSPTASDFGFSTLRDKALEKRLGVFGLRLQARLKAPQSRKSLR